ncbi:hypothetical protein ACFPRL_13200 [Pseudoclavibacter helvolus]
MRQWDPLEHERAPKPQRHDSCDDAGSPREISAFRHDEMHACVVKQRPGQWQTEDASR